MNVDTRQDDTGVVKGNFKSCTLAASLANWDVITHVSLLPEKFAKAGKLVEIEHNGEWRTWLVQTASDSIVVDPVGPRILIRHHRRATGDSMPKTNNNGKK